MNFTVIIALCALAVVMAFLLLGAIYLCVSKYAKRLDPVERERQDHDYELRHVANHH